MQQKQTRIMIRAIATEDAAVTSVNVGNNFPIDVASAYQILYDQFHWKTNNHNQINSISNTNKNNIRSTSISIEGNDDKVDTNDDTDTTDMLVFVSSKSIHDTNNNINNTTTTISTNHEHDRINDDDYDDNQNDHYLYDNTNSNNNNDPIIAKIQMAMEFITNIPNTVFLLLQKKYINCHDFNKKLENNDKQQSTDLQLLVLYTLCLIIVCQPIPTILAIQQYIVQLQQQQQQRQQQQTKNNNHSTNNNNKTVVIMNFIIHHVVPTVLNISNNNIHYNNNNHNIKNYTTIPTFIQPQQEKQKQDLALSIWNCFDECNHDNWDYYDMDRIVSILLSLPKQLLYIITTTITSRTDETTTTTSTNTRTIIIPKWITNESLYLIHCILSSLQQAVITVLAATTTTTVPNEVLESNIHDDLLPPTNKGSIHLFRTLIRYILRRNNSSSSLLHNNNVIGHAIYLYSTKNYQTVISNTNHTLTFGTLLFHLLFDSQCLSTLPPTPNFVQQYNPKRIQHDTTNNSLSSTETAILYRAILLFVIQKVCSKNQVMDYNYNIINNDPHTERMVQLMVDICNPMLEYYSSDIVQYIVTTSSSISILNQNGNHCNNSKQNSEKCSSVDHRWLCHVLALQLSRCSTETLKSSSNGQHENDTGNVDVKRNDDDDDNDDYDGSRKEMVQLDTEIPALSEQQSSPLSLLYHHLCNIAVSWSQMTFVYQTDATLQQHVTAFLLSGISILIQFHTIHNIPTESLILYYTTLSTRLIEGVTLRLSTSIATSIRIDGMQIGQQLAALLGQPNIQFDELNNNQDESNSETVQLEQPILDHTTTHENEGERNHEDDDSDWDDDNDLLTPYDIDDDEEDLRFVPRPLYLSECLDYLRTPDTDDTISYRHEAVLKDLSRLVRTRPMDLIDYGPELARSVLRLENKYNMTNFNTLVADTLCALVVEDPISVGNHLIIELFEDGTLRDRLMILQTLNDASYELSGCKQIDDMRQKDDDNKETSLLNPNIPRIAGKHKLLSDIQTSNESNNNNNNTIQQRTRRWGNGRRHNIDPSTNNNNNNNRMKQNYFAIHNIASEWFYMLSGSFIKSKDSTSLWDGTIGATLVSNVIITLSCIVRNASTISYYTPTMDSMAYDLYKLSWPLHIADIAQVRIAVMYAIGTSIHTLSNEAVVSLIMEHHHTSSSSLTSNNKSSNNNFITNIQHICDNDPDKECRILANEVRSILVTTIKSISDLQNLLLL